MSAMAKCRKRPSLNGNTSQLGRGPNKNCQNPSWTEASKQGQLIQPINVFVQCNPNQESSVAILTQTQNRKLFLGSFFVEKIIVLTHLLNFGQLKTPKC